MSNTSPNRLARLWILVALVLLASACAADATVTWNADATAERPAARGERAVAAYVTDDGSAESAASEATRETQDTETPDVERSSSSDGYRFEMFISFDGAQPFGNPDVPYVTGAVAGDRTSFTIHVGDSLVALEDDEVNRENMDVHYVMTGSSVYLYSPLFGELTQQYPEAFEGVPMVDTVSNGWGRYDLTLLGVDELPTIDLAPTSLDAMQMLDILRSSGVVRDEGTSSVRGVATRVLITDVAFDELAKAMGEQESIGLSPSTYDAMATTPVEVHIDADGQVRRMEARINLADALPVAQRSSETDVTFWMRLDLFDFGEQIEIALPIDAADITSEMQELIELQQG